MIKKKPCQVCKRKTVMRDKKGCALCLKCTVEGIYLERKVNKNAKKCL